ncbi:DUF4214 domain-containing protein [Rubritepida flocculans]|uniref:DUF4214 domain-containing protein n=1 Tax=Rubritepida flocculans TaxID=182403 RepID=UPI00042440C6|nr:DUF4214 domain-containing protein [Rubritepida flocculans]
MSEAAPIRAGLLLWGADEDVVINLYLAVLGRWPDEGGFANYMGLLAQGPAQRARMFEELRHSEEARARALPLDPDLTPGGEAESLAAQLRLRTRWFQAELARLAARPAGGTDPALAEALATARQEIAALRAEQAARLAAIEAALAGAIPPAPVLSPALSLGHVNDLVEVLRAELLERLRRLELRVLEAEKGTGRSA